ncbi:GL14219 [Drosophila persimilis]|uniref:GL14219 n=1 Tax=Drosophila persimilis TaxID=7234 RepID=B4GTS0_DROPE|nr:GL14219 [Drosophila persimilis]
MIRKHCCRRFGRLLLLDDLSENEVNHLADESASSAHKRESTCICFVGKRDFKSFIRGAIPYNSSPLPVLKPSLSLQYIASRSGQFVDIDIHQWTVGQPCRLVSFLQTYIVARKIHSKIFYVNTRTP